MTEEEKKTLNELERENLLIKGILEKMTKMLTVIVRILEK